MSNKKGLFALSPLLVFLAIYLGSAILASDFYKVPISVAFMLASIYAVATLRGYSMQQRIAVFSQGAGTPSIMLMLWVFILAGAFAASASHIGCIDATVNAMLTIMPHSLVLPGLFLSTCLISMAIGTSVGCIVALVPIAAGMAASMHGNTAFYTAIVVSGAFFGDNLSFISDTTIAATTTQRCNMADKFKANAYIALPAAIIVFIIYAVLGAQSPLLPPIGQVQYIKLLPYAVVLVAAIMGLNVLVVLALGIALTGLIGVFTDSTTVYGWFTSMGSGIMGMGELIIITMLAGGMFEIVKENRGIEYVIQKTTHCIQGKRGGQLVIGALVSVVNVCTANNTVAIITVGGIARRLGLRYGIAPRRVASLLDTFACFMQGLLPYGAQMLMAAGLAHITPVDIMPHLYYTYMLGAMALLSIMFSFPNPHTR